jgi:Ferredoxin
MKILIYFIRYEITDFKKGDMIMKAAIDREGCIACGLCAGICPNVFRMADDGFAEVYVDPVPAEAENDVKEACDSCPVAVISFE